ncbi:hypothetical protein K1719_030737 [Acacia pycnantha]|nr:hypothetical protein K1719_030737 [Acacia pycnantha]
MDIEGSLGRLSSKFQHQNTPASFSPEQRIATRHRPSFFLHGTRIVDRRQSGRRYFKITRAGGSSQLPFIGACCFSS